MVRGLPHLNGITVRQCGRDKSLHGPGLSRGPCVPCGAQVSGKPCRLGRLKREVRPTARIVPELRWSLSIRLKSATVRRGDPAPVDDCH
jgi:hypothetical protein